MCDSHVEISEIRFLPKNNRWTNKHSFELDVVWRLAAVSCNLLATTRERRSTKRIEQCKLTFVRIRTMSGWWWREVTCRKWFHPRISHPLDTLVIRKGMRIYLYLYHIPVQDIQLWLMAGLRNVQYRAFTYSTNWSLFGLLVDWTLLGVISIQKWNYKSPHYWIAGEATMRRDTYPYHYHIIMCTCSLDNLIAKEKEWTRSWRTTHQSNLFLARPLHKFFSLHYFL